MNTSSDATPDLEERFLPPEGWRWHSFRNPQGRMLRFGTGSPKSRIPDAVVIGLPGLSEFSEKYFELARDLLKRNLSFWILDWQGQGKSDRYLPDRDKRHSRGFNFDMDDLHYFLMEYIKHSAVHPDVGRIPMVMLAHSMGANIGLRYMHDHPDIFACAALNAPMFGLRKLEKLPFGTALFLSEVLRAPLSSSYAPGGKDWRKSRLKNHGESLFSGDPDRGRIHNEWCVHDPDLRTRGLTYGWVHEAMVSCARQRSKGYLESIKTPCLVNLSGKERFVTNRDIRQNAARLENCTLVEEPEAGHDLFMERDEIRNRFLDAFDKFMKENVLDNPARLKPF